MGKKQNPLQARVKRMMQADVEVGKIAGPTPALISAIPVSACPSFTRLLSVWFAAAEAAPTLLSVRAPAVHKIKRAVLTCR